MPIDYTVNHENKCIFTRCSGQMDVEDFEQYFSQIWSDVTHHGYNELFDAREAYWDRFDFSVLFELAQKAAVMMNILPGSRLAFVITEGRQQELLDFYLNARSMASNSSRQFNVFYDHEAARKWLAERD